MNRTSWSNGVTRWATPGRWEFESLAPNLPRVTETFDHRDAGAIENALNYYTLTGARKANAAGVEATLVKLRDSYADR